MEWGKHGSDLICLHGRFSATWFDQPNLWTSVPLPVEPSIRPRYESGTSWAPGASGAAASLESPWRAVKVGSIQRVSFCPSVIVLRVAFSFIHQPFQHMLMSCWTSTIAFHKQHLLNRCTAFWRRHSTQLSRTKSVSFHFPFILFFWKWEKALKPSTWQLSFFSSSHWTPWLVDEGFQGPCAQTTQRKPILEGTQVTLGTCHKPMLFPFFFSGLNFARTALKISHSLIVFFFSPLSSAVKRISRQRTKCVIYRLDAKSGRCKGAAVLHRGELLHFPASLDSQKESVSERH